MDAVSNSVPAGWYPDPLGLPQLRWWDGNAWTEFTSTTAVEAEPEVDDEPTRVIDLDDDLDDDALDDDVASEMHAEPESEPEAEPEPAIDPEPEVDTASAPPSAALVPEPISAEPTDPFEAAEANALAFTSRRARREYERKRELEAGPPDRVEQPYSHLDTNPIDIQVTGAAAAAAAAATEEASLPDMPVDAQDEVLVEPTPEPQQPAAADDEPRFSLDATPVSDELAPERTLIPKLTYTLTGFLLAVLIPIAVLVIIALRYAPGLTLTSVLAWSIGAGAFILGLLVAFLDSSTLRRWGHERTASPLWALLTPIVYLSVRSVATRRETGHGRAVILAWVIGLILAGLLVALFPDVLSLLVPGFVPPWASPIG